MWHHCWLQAHLVWLAEFSLVADGWWQWDGGFKIKAIINPSLPPQHTHTRTHTGTHTPIFYPHPSPHLKKHDHYLLLFLWQQHPGIIMRWKQCVSSQSCQSVYAKAWCARVLFWSRQRRGQSIPLTCLMRSSSSGCCKTLFEVFRIGCWLVALHLREELWVANYLPVLLFVLIGPCCTWLVHIWLEQLDIQEMILVRRLMELQCLHVQLSLIVSEREEKTMTGAKVWHDSCVAVWRTGQEVLLSYFPSAACCRAPKKEDSAWRTQDKVLRISFLPQETGWLTEASHNYNLVFRQDLCNANHQIEAFSYSASAQVATLVIPHSAIRGVSWAKKKLGAMQGNSTALHSQFDWFSVEINVLRHPASPGRHGH